MTWNLTSFVEVTVFQSYQDDGWLYPAEVRLRMKKKKKKNNTSSEARTQNRKISRPAWCNEWSQ